MRPGVVVRVLATPGHTADSASFVVGDEDGCADRRHDARVAAPPSSRIRTASWRPTSTRCTGLQDLGDAVVLTGHGPELPSIARRRRASTSSTVDERLDQVRAALATLGPDATARQIVEIVYADVDRAVWSAADLSVEAQLAYLRATELRSSCEARQPAMRASASTGVGGAAIVRANERANERGGRAARGRG